MTKKKLPPGFEDDEDESVWEGALCVMDKVKRVDGGALIRGSPAGICGSPAIHRFIEFEIVDDVHLNIRSDRPACSECTQWRVFGSVKETKAVYRMKVPLRQAVTKDYLLKLVMVESTMDL